MSWGVKLDRYVIIVLSVMTIILLIVFCICWPFVFTSYLAGQMDFF